jgi:hypothetical protein
MNEDFAGPIMIFDFSGDESRRHFCGVEEIKEQKRRQPVYPRNY